MLIVSKKIDYALIALTEMAEGSGKYISSKSIADEYNLSSRFLDRVMSHLKKGGLVKSLEGKGGGYILSGPAREIKVLDVIRAVEGELVSPFCTKQGKCFSIGCSHSNLWDEARKNLEKTFASFKISDFVGNVKIKYEI